MVTVRSIRATILASLILVSLSQSGCSVFSSIGGWFSQSYDDTVAYFNAYYNAKRLFDEAESEVLAARTSLKAKSQATATPAAPVGSSAKQKFTAVIDKCSNILSFYPKSGIVDDALFLIGKSYFYQDEFLKAERKFTELMSKGPKGAVGFQCQVWLLKTYQKLNKYDEANRVGQALAASAGAAGEDAIAGEALMILGDMAVSQKNTEAAIDQYTKSVAASDNGAMQAVAQVKIGDLYFSIPDYDKAAAAYLDVRKYSPDDYTIYDSQIQAAISLRHAGKYEQALTLLRKLESDYRYLDYRGTIRYEIGNTYERSGQLEEAENMFRLVDTTNSRTDAGARAAFQLGKLYQYDFGRYADARIAYAHASVGGSPELTLDAGKRATAFDSYFKLQRQFIDIDSTLNILDVDSLWLKRDTLSKRARSDSALGVAGKTAASNTARRDSSSRSTEKDTSTVFVKRDSTSSLAAKLNPSVPAVKDSSLAAPKRDSAAAIAKRDSTVTQKETIVFRRGSRRVRGVRDSLQVAASKDTSQKRIPTALLMPRPSRDSLLSALGNVSYLLGELFYSELDVPDSTFYWLNQSLNLGLDSVKAPRALYVLSEVARSDSARKYGEESDLYEMIVERYPRSVYAEEARIALGYSPTEKKVDPASAVYAVAESLMYAGKYKQAVDSLQRIADKYGTSPLAPKSRYMIAWIYETQLAIPDSALVQYKLLAEKFATTKYGLAAIRRIPPPEALAKPAVDSTKKVLADTTRKAGSQVAKNAIPDSTRKELTKAPLKSVPDSLNETPLIHKPKLDPKAIEPDLDQKPQTPQPKPDTLGNRKKKEEYPR